MKFVFIADLHLTKYSQDKIDTETDLAERLSSSIKSLRNIAKYCVGNSIKNVVIGGDIFDSKSVIHTVALKCFKDFLAEFPLKYYIIDGNHDLSDKGEKAVSSLISIESEPNVIRIHPNGETIFEDVLCIPNSSKMIQTIKNRSAKFLVSHFGLSEALLQSGISVVSDVSLKDLIGKYKYVLLGHYHKPQQIVNDSIQVYYSGSIIHLDWGEKNEVKRFLVIDTEKEIIESIPTFGYKKYIEIQIENQEDLDEVLQRVEKIKESGHYVRLNNINKIEISDEVRNEITVIEKPKEDVANRGINISMSERDKLEQYLKVRDVNEKFRDECLQEGLNIIDSCSAEEK